MKIGIIGAMEEEVAVLKEAMEIEETYERASMVFCKGVLCGKDVVVVRSGIGKVNAGICAQILADKFNVDVLITFCRESLILIFMIDRNFFIVNT